MVPTTGHRPELVVDRGRQTAVEQWPGTRTIGSCRIADERRRIGRSRSGPQADGRARHLAYVVGERANTRPEDGHRVADGRWTCIPVQRRAAARIGIGSEPGQRAHPCSGRGVEDARQATVIDGGRPVLRRPRGWALFVGLRGPADDPSVTHERTHEAHDGEPARDAAGAGHHSPSVMMICVSPPFFRKVLNRTSAATSVGGLSPGITPIAVMIPSKPEFTDWMR